MSETPPPIGTEFNTEPSTTFVPPAEGVVSTELKLVPESNGKVHEVPVGIMKDGKQVDLTWDLIEHNTGTKGWDEAKETKWHSLYDGVKDVTILGEGKPLKNGEKVQKTYRVLEWDEDVPQDEVKTTYRNQKYKDKSTPLKKLERGEKPDERIVLRSGVWKTLHDGLRNVTIGGDGNRLRDGRETYKTQEWGEIPKDEVDLPPTNEELEKAAQDNEKILSDLSQEVENQSQELNQLIEVIYGLRAKMNAKDAAPLEFLRDSKMSSVDMIERLRQQLETRNKQIVAAKVMIERLQINMGWKEEGPDATEFRIGMRVNAPDKGSKSGKLAGRIKGNIDDSRWKVVGIKDKRESLLDYPDRKDIGAFGREKSGKTLLGNKKEQKAKDGYIISNQYGETMLVSKENLEDWNRGSAPTTLETLVEHYNPGGKSPNWERFDGPGNEGRYRITRLGAVAAEGMGLRGPRRHEARDSIELEENIDGYLNVIEIIFPGYKSSQYLRAHFAASKRYGKNYIKDADKYRNSAMLSQLKPEDIDWADDANEFIKGYLEGKN